MLHACSTSKKKSVSSSMTAGHSCEQRMVIQLSVVLLACCCSFESMCSKCDHMTDIAAYNTMVCSINETCLL
jgi:hypothetical protein